jgi:hypothetical protein
LKKKTTDEYNYGKFRDYNTTSKVNIEYNKKHTNFFSSCSDPLDEKLFNFPKFVSRQSITYFICKYELFKKILPLHGSIVECGVLFGGGLMTFAHLSTIFEPVNYNRKIIGFDTFSGFPSISKKDKQSTSQFNRVGNLNANSYDDLVEAIKLFDLNRFVNHIPKIELVKGDATKTIPKYVKDNPQLVINLLYLDFDLYEPTKTALETFLPRMTKGSIIAFDELNWKNWAGETEAVMDTIGLNKLKIERFTFGANISYVVLNEDP